jgi:hypothetical protein
MPYDVNKYRASTGGGKRIPADKVVAWIARYFDYKERKDGDEILICNPFTGDSSFKMNINPEKGVVHCWTGDEWAGAVNPSTGKRNCSFIQLVKVYKKCSYVEAVQDVLGDTKDARDYLRPENRASAAEPLRKVEVALPQGTERLADSDGSEARIVKNWIKRRGYSNEDISKHDIHYLGMECYWPYYEFDSLVYWQSRGVFNKRYSFPPIHIRDKDGKVIGQTDCSIVEFFYGFDDCEIANYIIITESIFGQHTLGDQALASGGAALTPAQIGKVRILGPRKGVILSPDNDKAGIKSALANGTLLEQQGFKVFCSLPPKLPYTKNGETKMTKDWNEFVEELGMTNAEVRSLHDKYIALLTPKEQMRLRGLLQGK